MGIDESTLKPFYFVDDTTSTGTSTVGKEIVVVKQDTAANIIEMKIEHFSMFRLATVSSNTSTISKVIPIVKSSGMLPLSSVLMRDSYIGFHVANVDKEKEVSITLLNMQGRVVATLFQGIPGTGTYNISLSNNSDPKYFCSGRYILCFIGGNSYQEIPVTIFR